MAFSEEHRTATKPLYQYDERLREHVARVTAVTPLESLSDNQRALFKSAPDQSFVVEMAETIFYAQGGGQPCDTGYISLKNDQQKEVRLQVDAVRSGGNNRILHLVTGADAASVRPGDMVEQHIDGAKRDLNSRNHTAGHVVALAVLRLMETTPELRVIDSKASHYPDACFVEFLGLIDGKYKEAIQQQTTAFVKDALPVKLFWCLPDELEANNVITAQGMPILTGADGKVRIVDIVGAGAYPCGGTHVPDTSYVGEVVVRNIKRQKGITKISYKLADQ